MLVDLNPAEIVPDLVVDLSDLLSGNLSYIFSVLLVMFIIADPGLVDSSVVQSRHLDLTRLSRHQPLIQFFMHLLDNIFII